MMCCMYYSWCMNLFAGLLHMMTAQTWISQVIWNSDSVALKNCYNYKRFNAKFRVNGCTIVYRMCSRWTSNWIYSASTRRSWLESSGQRMHQASSMAHSMLLARGIAISYRIISSILASRSCIPSRNSAKSCWISRPNSFRSHLLNPKNVFIIVVWSFH